jgi:hypothetical protein
MSHLCGPRATGVGEQHNSISIAEPCSRRSMNNSGRGISLASETVQVLSILLSHHLSPSLESSSNKAIHVASDR